MRFTWDPPYHVDATKFARAFWSDPTPFETGVRERRCHSAGRETRAVATRFGPLRQDWPAHRSKSLADLAGAQCSTGAARRTIAPRSTPRGTSPRRRRPPLRSATPGIVRHLRRRVLQQQCGLDREHHVAGERASLRLVVAVVRSETPLQSVRHGTKALIGLGGGADFLEQDGDFPGTRPSTRSTSRHITLPAPSQIEFSGISREIRGRALSST